jgi:ABC-type tungstate transport system permease subunit/ABC-type tungstate transport system substrate-binding protein
LLDDLTPQFEQAYPNHRIQIFAVGTGEALELGRRRDVDVLLVHSPEAELAFLEAGYGHDRRPLMRNDFVIVGPPDDPAGIRGVDRVFTALETIADRGAPFVSRGDDSGTHDRELDLWADAGIAPAGEWYAEIGQGMGATLLLASERGAYTLTDRSTFVTMSGALDLEIMVEADPPLINVYSVIEVTGAENFEGARDFARWLRGPDAQTRIGDFGVERFGTSLFTPLARPDVSAPSATGSRFPNPFAEAIDLLLSGDTYLLDIIRRSLLISGAALLIATLIGIPIGTLVALSNFRLRAPVIALINTGLAFPPVVVGLAIFLLLSRSGPLGVLDLLYSPTAIILAQVVLAGPYIAAITLAAVAELPADVRLQARGLGATRFQALGLQLREVRGSLVAAVAAGFGAVISEVGAVMIVGGNLLGETRVMTTAIVLETRRGNFGVAIALGAVLLLLAFAVNLLLMAVTSNRTRRPLSS